MLTVYLAVAMLLVVAATGAPLKRLGGLRIRRVWLLWVALIDQILVISIIPDTHPAALATAHIASYVLAAICLVANRRLPGIGFIGAGGLLNGLTIAVNGGTLPASASALRASGFQEKSGQFANSGVLAHPKLPWLGDVVATPSWLPGHNVFSVGDVLIWIGLAWLLWRTCRPGRRAGPYVARHAQAAEARPAARHATAGAG